MNVLKEKRGAFTVFAIFFISGLTIIATFPKLDIQLYTNRFFHPIGASIAKVFTMMVEGWFTVPLLIFLVIKSWRKAIYVGICYGISAVVAGLIKQMLWFIERPYGEKILKLSQTYKWPENVELHTVRSFPSGHTTTAFCLLFSLVIITKNKKAGIVLMVLACLIALSRTYLSLHFMMDLVAGSAIGIGTSIGMYYAFKKLLKL